MELRIDPEFQSKIPPLTEAEFAQLKENILSDGKVKRPISTWNGVIVDGHNRWKIIQENPWLPYTIEELNFPDKWAAFGWMYKNQLGQRNLTEQQQAYLRGKMYEARKNSVGAQIGNENAKKQCSQSGNIESSRVSEQIAAEQHVGKNTVLRDAKYAQGIDAIRWQDPSAAGSILKGELPVTKADVMALAKEKDEPTLRQKIEKLRKGEPIREKKEVKTKEEDEKPMGKPMIRTSEPIVAVTPQIKPEKEIPIAENPRAYMAGTKENKELNRLMRTSIAELENKIPAPVYTVDMMLGELTATIDMYSRTIETFYQTHRNMYTKANQAAIEKVYKECLIGRMMKMKEEIEYV